MNRWILILSLLVPFFFQNTVWGSNGLRCEMLFSHGSAPEGLRISDRQSLAQALTKGMILRPEQANFFDLYLKDYFGNRFFKIGFSNFDLAYHHINQHPELQKNHFREYEIFDHSTNHKVRVRSLSLQESPFRSRLGGDCATNTYFDKAFDPNYYYFTMTDAEANSLGQITLVLGTATSPVSGRPEKIAFLDKVQNVPNERIKTFLSAISMSLAEQGYKLGVPTQVEFVHEDTGISIYQKTTDYFSYQVLPYLKMKALKFTPHPNQYDFPNKYSNAYLEMDVMLFEAMVLDENIAITKGQLYESYLAPADLDMKMLLQNKMNFKNSKHKEDLIQFIDMAENLSILEMQKIYSASRFVQDLLFILDRKDVDRETRVHAASKILLLAQKDFNTLFSSLLERLSPVEEKLLTAEIQKWQFSYNIEKKFYFHNISKHLYQAAGNNDMNAVQLALRFGADIMYSIKTDYEATALFSAVVNGHLNILQYLIEYQRQIQPQVVLPVDALIENAKKEKHKDIIQYLRSLKAKS